ncbi:nickel resistance protein [Kaistia algarum]|uniref:metal-sensing transcriptional repressor n=1 Tax=Kaistia algarum TaxID=2083279 RepID=UPI000CE745E3|nr:metal-sensing transcriptional repressor [Kaistia algarum]MCX5512413.1 metal-sensing transcriptional repressor [Kaistia algarum]PPE80493.1 nickel resistance protein [Kaistia algarum]
MSHANSPEILMRLRRAAGHLSSVMTMVEDGRDCLLITQQLQAVIKALEGSKRELIHHHIDEHLGPLDTVKGESGRDLRTEIRELAKYL